MVPVTCKPKSGAVSSEYSGIVREILVEDSQPVEYGQVLFKIDPNG